MDETATPCRTAAKQNLAQALERGEVVHFAACPFRLPAEADLKFLLAQRLASRAHKNIGYDPNSEKVTGHHKEGVEQSARLAAIFARFSADVTRWAGAVFPEYARGWRLDRVSYRPEEEATRKLRLTARNDLLHVDAFPSRPTNGWRILRIFANINPQADRIWITTDPFAKLLARYGQEVGLPGSEQLGWSDRLKEALTSLFRLGRAKRSTYDSFMLRFHNWMKANKDFQENTPKRVWHFGPGSAWLAITDTASHAVLGGRYALEHSYFVSPDSLTLPNESPAALLQQACGREILNRAA